MYFADIFLTRGRLPLSSFLCFVGGFSMGSWLTLFHQLQMERDLIDDLSTGGVSQHEPFLLLAIVILSAPQSFELRDTLRSTWLKLNPSSRTVKHFFSIGTNGLDETTKKRLEMEQLVHDNDLLLLPDLVDSFNNLTYKMSSSLVALSSSIPYHYILKTDDDSFARIDLIVNELEEHRIHEINSKISQRRCYYWGFFDGRAKTKKYGKWKESDYNICDFYLPYALGGGYILNRKCSDFVVKNHLVLTHYRNEDVSMGTWLSSISPERRHDVRFDTEYESRGCSNEYLVQHKLTQAEMVERYKNLVTKGQLCTHEFKKRPSYIYDWTGPPSKCCTRNSTII